MLWTLLTPVIFSALDHLPVTPSAAPSGSRHALRGELRRMVNIAGWIAVTAGAAGGQAWLVHNLWSAASQWSEPAQRTLTSPLLGLPYLIETNLQPALLLVLYYAILFRRHRTKRDEERAARLERSLFEARLHVISRQLEPHFLFNTLNAIAGLTSEQPAVAEAMLVRLSELLRIAFDSSVGETVSLQTELERLDMYTDLYCMRFGDRLTVRRVVEATTLSAAVPTFLLQPLVENAIAHGFAARRGTGAIDISARRVGARIRAHRAGRWNGIHPGRAEARGGGTRLHAGPTRGDVPSHAFNRVAVLAGRGDESHDHIPRRTGGRDRAWRGIARCARHAPRLADIWCRRARWARRSRSHRAPQMSAGVAWSAGYRRTRRHRKAVRCGWWWSMTSQSPVVG